MQNRAQSVIVNPMFADFLIVVLVVGLLVAAITLRSRGRNGGAIAAGFVAVGLGACWWLYEPHRPATPNPNKNSIENPTLAVTSTDCAQCHKEQYDSWHQTFHRTMTRDATPEYVKGNFAGVTYEYQGIKTRLDRSGDEFYMETVDPDWAADHTKGSRAPPRTIKLRIDRTVGSHWIQEYFHRAPTGRLVRLPVLYHIVEKRWVHSNGAFLTPDSNDFWAQCRGRPWNDTCLYCHNTEPVKNPVRNPAGRTIGYDTQVTELGIACAACHGPGLEHVRAQRNERAATGETDVVHPAHLPIARRDEICARCHGALVPKPAMWDPATHRDPFVPGQELTLYNHIFWSEAQQAELVGHHRPGTEPSPMDGRFWADGTPLTTGLEYNGMALSACYQGAKGKLSCLSCHTMHGDDPNFMLKPNMSTNEACYKCHADYRNKLAEHTRHPANSAGSLCYNCHMPHVVYSLLNTHRTHRIQIPDLAGSVGTGKPHACNLCHLDKSLGWTRDELGKWPGRKNDATVKLSGDEQQISAAVLALANADARTRVMIAGAFSNPAARQAAGDDWFGVFITRLLRDERYPAVRYLAHRGLRLAYGETSAGPFDYLAIARDREAQLDVLQARFDSKPIRRAAPYLPLTTRGLPDDAVLERLRKSRSDPDLRINE